MQNKDVHFADPIFVLHSYFFILPLSEAHISLK
jgi:hypothetical protein